MVYFIQQGKDGPIKIGFTQSESLKNRLAQLQTASAKPLHVLARFAGDVEYEKQLHEQFKKYRLEGEWFEPSEEIMDFLGLKEQNPIERGLNKLAKEIKILGLNGAGTNMGAIEHLCLELHNLNGTFSQIADELKEIKEIIGSKYEA